MKTAFDKIAAGLTDAIAYAEGDTSRGRIAAPLDVRAIRKATGKTQDGFAEAYRIPVATVKDWEQKRRAPDAPARALLSAIHADPTTMARLLANA